LAIIGHLSPAQHDFPAAILPSFDIDVFMGHLSPAQHAILLSLWVAMSHLPSLQQLPSLPQQDIFSLVCLSPALPSVLSWMQQAHALAFSAAAAGVAGVTV
jgi:hypothetical protein